MLAWVVAYVATCAVEIPVFVVLLRTLGWLPSGRRPLVRIAVVAWALQLTHPVFWLIDPAFPAGVVVAEVVIVIVEAAALLLWAVRRAGARWGASAAWTAGLVSFAANGLSCAVGLLAAAAFVGG